MKRNVLINGILGEVGLALASTFMLEGYYVYGTDKEEDFENRCDRFFKFDINEFVNDVSYRIKFTTIFEDIIPRLDVLINCPGVHYRHNLEEISLEDWQESLNVNLTGPLLLIKLFLGCLENTNGSIVNISGGTPPMVNYFFTQSALIGLTKTIASEVKGRVRINSICAIHEEMDFQNESDPIIYKDFPIEKGSIEPYPENVAKLTSYLSSEQAQFIHGANFQLNFQPRN